MDIEYVDIMTREICLQFRFWASFIGQFVHPEVGEDIGKKVGGCFFILVSKKYHCIRERENLVQHPSNYISIVMRILQH